VTSKRIEISTWDSDIAPKSARWNACLNEYDLGTSVFTGATEREAVNELLDSIEQDSGELQS